MSHLDEIIRMLAEENDFIGYEHLGIAAEKELVRLRADLTDAEEMLRLFEGNDPAGDALIKQYFLGKAEREKA